jgi:hypothetical protein
VDPKVRESIIKHLENLKIIMKLILPTGCVADIFVRGPFAVSFENKLTTPIWQKTSFFICATIRNFVLVLNQRNWIDSGASLVTHIPFRPCQLTEFVTTS